MRCGTLHGLSNLLPLTHGRAKVVSEAYAFPMGVLIFRGSGFPLTNSHPALVDTVQLLRLHQLRQPFRDHRHRWHVLHLLPVAEALKLFSALPRILRLEASEREGDDEVD